MRSLRCGIFVLTMLSPLNAQDQPFDQDKDIRMGPAVGERIPDFRARDQNGQWQDFDSIKGPKGAVIVFHRSADW